MTRIKAYFKDGQTGKVDGHNVTWGDRRKKIYFFIY